MPLPNQKVFNKDMIDKICANTSVTITTSIGSGNMIDSRPIGWVCPNCGRGVSPYVQYCDCNPVYSPIYVPIDYNVERRYDADINSTPTKIGDYTEIY